MNIAILSRGPQLYSTQSLQQAARKRGHNVEIIDFMLCQVIMKDKPEVWLDGNPLTGIDGIIPRVGTSVTSHGAAVIRQFEVMGTPTTSSSQALLQARDKLWAFQKLTEGGIKVPKTVFSNFTYHTHALIKAVGGLPVVIKLLQGTHGMGVILAKDQRTASSIIEAMFKSRQKFLVQEYIAESSGTDIRAIVVDGRVICSMKRKAQAGEFRANLHRGGHGVNIHLNDEQKKIVIKAAKLLGLRVAGVDMLLSNNGPLLLEVNASPGLEGIETVTRVDVADSIIESLERASREKV